jgi:hypothetical protein
MTKDALGVGWHTAESLKPGLSYSRNDSSAAPCSDKTKA